MIDLPEPGTSPGPARAGTSRARAAVRAAPKALPLSALAPVHRALDLPAPRPGEVPLPAPEADGFSPYAASDDVLKTARPEQTGALAWVYRKAQLTIGYPQAFIHHDITGSAQARLVFDRTGKLKPELLHVRADSPYLRVYVYRVLESTFTREPVPASLVRWPDTFEVFCYVQFSLGASTSVAVASDHPVVGNKLFFRRHGFKPNEALSWKLGPLSGLFPVPVVGMDMTWFYRKYQDHKHPLKAAADADDLAPFRQDPLFYD